ncbi:MAG: DEAD/DEAH box helicase [Spirochaetales bacterium]|jgi:ATP-dependent RNA helicase RhlB|nr:DEAD/DEAH box helicase [Spirochaetales bacterium]
MKFSELNLDENLRKSIDEAGFTECFPVQEETFRRTLLGLDVTVQSQTGSGKTAAFLITIFQQLAANEKFKGRKALIIVPTRELATQIEADARVLGKYMPLKIGSFFGGIGYGAQEAVLREGVDIMIGTPGRLIDFSRQKKINLEDVGILVIDEADRLFDMGFLPDLRKLLRKMRPAEERLTMLLSATLGLRVSSLAWEYMNGAEEIQIDPEQVTVETITQELYHVSSAEKFRLLLGILRKNAPKSAIIFTNTKHAAEEISKRLNLNGYKSQFIIGDLPQKKRLRIIDDMKEGVISFLVATDVAARGLHVDDLDLVVNYDIPEDAENYVHRIGRTARVGKSGLAVSLACEKFVFGLEAIEKYIGARLPVLSFTEEDFAEDKSAGMKIHTERYGRPGRDRDERGDRRGGRSRDSGRRPPHRGETRSREEARFGRRRDEADFPSRAGGAQRPSSPASPPHVRHEGKRPADHTKDRRPAMNAEERLTFYKEKYGEDFRAGGGGHPHSGRKGGRTEGRRDRPRDGRKFSQGKPAPSQHTGARPQAPSPAPKPAHEIAAAPPEKKPGFLKKFLGLFSGKKE